MTKTKQPKIDLTYLNTHDKRMMSLGLQEGIKIGKAQAEKDWCEHCYEEGQKAEQERIDSLAKNVKIRTCISYPTMLQHHYISERDFKELISKIKEKNEKCI